MYTERILHPLRVSVAIARDALNHVIWIVDTNITEVVDATFSLFPHVLENFASSVETHSIMFSL